MQFLIITEGYYAEFYGWDVALYYVQAVLTFMQEYSWQVRLSYGIILLCILMMIFLMILFSHRIRQRKRHQKNYDHCYDTYSEAFIEILESEDILTDQQIIEICDVEKEEDFAEYDGMLYAEIITHIRMSMHETLYFPNLQSLCRMTGALAAIEYNLKERKDVLRVIQIVNTLPLNINEGLLAIYTAHSNSQIAQLARVAHCMCSITEPYLYFLDDMNKQQSPWYRITIHRILGWKKEQNFPMPPLWMLATQCENTQMAAFLVEEISYWGTEEEKRQLLSFFNDPRIPCRIAAVRSLTRLHYNGIEEQLMSIYESQPQVVRREIQKALASFHSGKYTEFFANIYLNTPSLTSRKVALECLFDYCDAGRALFEQLAAQAKDKDAILFNQIRTTHQLQAQAC